MKTQRIRPAIYCIGQDPARDARLLARLFPVRRLPAAPLVPQQRQRPAPSFSAPHLPAPPAVPFTLPPLPAGSTL
jgi:hypothetical protein